MRISPDRLPIFSRCDVSENARMVKSNPIAFIKGGMESFESFYGNFMTGIQFRYKRKFVVGGGGYLIL